MLGRFAGLQAEGFCIEWSPYFLLIIHFEEAVKIYPQNNVEALTNFFVIV